MLPNIGMDIMEPEYIASYWTLAGNVVPLGPPDQEMSAHDFQERLAVAADLGYAGLGLMHSDLCNVLRKHDATSVRDMLELHAMKHLELEFLVGWMGDEEELDAAEKIFADMLRAANEIGVRHIKIGPDMNAKQWPLEKMIERFAGLCDRAAKAGSAIALEIMPWSNVTDLSTATSIVEGAARSNGGLLIDIWHIDRGGIDYQQLAKLPTGLITHVELNDADKEIRGTLIEDTLNNRKFCGDGELDVVAFLSALKAQGYDGPYGIEILSATERLRPFNDVAKDAIDTARREFDKLSNSTNTNGEAC